MRLIKESAFVALLCFMAISGFATAQTPQYDLDVIINPEEHIVTVDGVLRFSSSMIEDGQLIFLHAAETKSLELISERLIEYDVQKPENGPASILLTFTDDLPDTIYLNISYSLFIPADHSINRLTLEWIELNIDSFWHPVFSSIPNIQYNVTVDLGGDYELISGDQYSKTGLGKFTIRNTIPRLDIPFSAGKNLDSKKSSLVMAYSALDSVDLDGIVQKSNRILEFFKVYLERDQDFNTPRRIAVSPRDEVGYARKNYIVMSDIRTMSDTSLSEFLSHEFAHYWFSSANFQSKNHWLTESFAEYVSMIYMRETHGNKWLDKNLENKRNRIKQDPMHLAEFDERPSFIALYHRGPLVLHAFEENIGKDNFKKVLRSFIKNNIQTNEELFEMIKAELSAEASNKLQELLRTI